jgi:ribosomal protein L16 Arg81 hydroxylase
MQTGFDAADKLAGHFTDDLMRALLAERRVEIAPGLFAGPEPLLSRAALETALARRQIASDKIRAFAGRTQLDLTMQRVVDSRGINLNALAQLVAQGAMLLFNKLELRFAALNAFAAALAERFGVPVQVTAVLSFGDRSGISPHHDTDNVFIVQLEGSKQWQFLGDPVEPGLPVPAFKGEEGPAREVTLHPGDVMFLPAGQRHVCTSSPDDSLHLGVLIQAPRAASAGKTLLTAIEQDPPLLTPFLPSRDERARAQALADYRARLHQLVDELDLERILADQQLPDGPSGFSFPDRSKA